MILFLSYPWNCSLGLIKTYKHAPRYFISNLNFKSHNFQTESPFKRAAYTYRGGTTLSILVLATLFAYDSPICIDVIVIIDVQASLLLLQLSCGSCCDGIVAVDARASLPSLRWQLSPSL
jgi:hypothetical protein